MCECVWEGSEEMCGVHGSRIAVGWNGKGCAGKGAGSGGEDVRNQ